MGRCPQGRELFDLAYREMLSKEPWGPANQAYAEHRKVCAACEGVHGTFARGETR